MTGCGTKFHLAYTIDPTFLKGTEVTSAPETLLIKLRAKKKSMPVEARNVNTLTPQHINPSTHH